MPPAPVQQQTKDYDAFVSYSHRGQKQLATELQDALKGFDLPWYKRRALEIFRDDTALSVDPALWPSIETALDRSSWLVIVASPQSAESDWVGLEIEHWLSSRGSECLAVVVADGAYRCDPDSGAFVDIEGNAIHPALRSVSLVDPLLIDLRDTAGNETADASDPRFRLAVAPLAARLRGTTPESLLARDAARRRQASIVVRTAIVLLTVLTFAAAVGGIVALAGRRSTAVSRDSAVASQEVAEAQAETAIAQSLASTASSLVDGDGALALLLAAQAYHFDPQPETEAVLEQQLARDVTHYLHGGAGNYVDAELAADAPRVAAVDEAGTALAWDTETGELLFAVPGDAGNVAWSADGSLLLVADRRGQVRVYDGNGAEVQTVDTGHESFVLSEIGGGPHAITHCPRVQIPKSDNCQRTGEVQTVADLHPDGRYFVVYDASDDRLEAWDRVEGREVDDFRLPDGREHFDDRTGELLLQLAAVDLDRGVRRPLEPWSDPMCGQAQLYTGPQAYDPTLGLWVVDGLLVPYNPEQGSPDRPSLACFPADVDWWALDRIDVPITSAIRSIDLVSDGLAVFAAEQPAVMVGRLGAGLERSEASDLLAAACEIAGRNLTRAEWARYAPGWPPEPLCFDPDGVPLGGPEPVVGSGRRPAPDTAPLAPAYPDVLEVSEAYSRAGLDPYPMADQLYTNTRDDIVYRVTEAAGSDPLFVRLVETDLRMEVVDTFRDDGRTPDPEWLVRLEGDD
jgi:hypothetical protein